MIDLKSLDSFTRSYIETALWSTPDPDSDNEMHEDCLDGFYSVHDLAPETLEKMKADCAKFQSDNLIDIEDGCLVCDRMPQQRAGHDFWLTRNGHGAGFWDGDWEEKAGERLTKASHKFGECDLYPGDDGKLYI